MYNTLCVHMSKCCMCVCVSVICMYVHRYVYYVQSYLTGITISQLFDIIYREEVLQNVIRSVTRNVLSILLTGALAVILIYLYSILGHIFFSQDFRMETHLMSEPAIYINQC